MTWENDGKCWGSEAEPSMVELETVSSQPEARFVKTWDLL
jgi:hypothetical protein